MGRPQATLQILDLGHLALGVKRLEVSCPFGTTGATHVPGPVDLSDGVLTLLAAWSHEGRCGRCSVDDLLDQGDAQVRAATEAAWAELQAGAMRGRGN